MRTNPAMAWRIEKSVIRGEIDNRTRGCVTGRIWFAGREEPLELRLTGNCWRDLAGRLLEFTNPEPKPCDLEGMPTLQEGTVGDITASRKVKVQDVLPEAVAECFESDPPSSWHWKNSLYLEWISETCGRVVIESAGFQLEVVGEPLWEMSPEEEATQRQANGAAVAQFVAEMEEAMNESDGFDFAETHGNIPAKEIEADARPQTEEEAAVVQAWGDRLVDHIRVRLTRENSGFGTKEILAEEIERLLQEHGEPELFTADQQARHAEWREEMNRVGGVAMGFPEPRGDLSFEHPLAGRAWELGSEMLAEAEERGWLTDEHSDEHPMAELLDSVIKAGTELRGVLNGREWPPALNECALSIVRLIRARVRLDDALRAMESCQEQKLVPMDWLAVVMVECIDLAHDADAIIHDLRLRLKRSEQ